MAYNKKKFAQSSQREREAKFEGFSPDQLYYKIDELQRRKENIERILQDIPDLTRQLRLYTQNHAEALSALSRFQKQRRRFLGLFPSRADNAEEQQLRSNVDIAKRYVASVQQKIHEISKQRAAVDLEYKVSTWDLNAANAALRKKLKERKLADRETVRKQQEERQIDAKKAQELRREAAKEKLRERAIAAERRAQELKVRVAAVDGKARKIAAEHKKRENLPTHCPYCGYSAQKYVLDHIIPISKGGLSAAWNMIYVCNTCNYQKSDLPLYEFCNSRGIDYPAVYKRLKKMGKRVGG